MDTVRLTITLGADGQVGLSVAGGQNKLLLLGLLDVARQLIHQPPVQDRPPPILLARGTLPR